MKISGYATWTELGADKPSLEIDTVACVHCGGHFAIQPGSGRIRGYCMNCSGPICGPSCAACVPVEQYLANLEAGLPSELADKFTPICVPTSIHGVS